MTTTTAPAYHAGTWAQVTTNDEIVAGDGKVWKCVARSGHQISLSYQGGQPVTRNVPQDGPVNIVTRAEHAPPATEAAAVANVANGIPGSAVIATPERPTPPPVATVEEQRDKLATALVAAVSSEPSPWDSPEAEALKGAVRELTGLMDQLNRRVESMEGSLARVAQAIAQ